MTDVELLMLIGAVVVPVVILGTVGPLVYLDKPLPIERDKTPIFHAMCAETGSRFERSRRIRFVLYEDFFVLAQYVPRAFKYDEIETVDVDAAAGWLLIIIRDKPHGRRLYMKNPEYALQLIRARIAKVGSPADPVPQHGAAQGTRE